MVSSRKKRYLNIAFLATLTTAALLGLPGETPAARVSAGRDAVPLILEQMARFEGDKFEDAAEILCRMKNRRAIRPLSRILFLEPWVPGLLDPDQLFDLRQAYLVKGSLESVTARLRKESMGVAGAGGGIPWDRVAP